MPNHPEVPITIRSVTSTLAGECREWTITAREAPARAHAVPVGCLPAAVLEAVCDWLDVAPPTVPAVPVVAGTEKTAQRGVQPQDGASESGGVDFHTDPVAAYRARDHETAVQRAEPNPNLLTLWDAQFVDHCDANASQLLTSDAVRLRVGFNHRAAVQQFVRDHDGDLHARWRNAAYRVRSISAPRGGLDVELEETRTEPEHIAMPKPPSVDQLLARLNDGQSLAEAAAPEAYERPEFVGTVPEYGQPVGTVTSGLIHVTPELAAAPEGTPICDQTQPDRPFVCTRPRGHTGQHAAHDAGSDDIPVSVWPTPGGPDDKLSLASVALGAVRFHTAGQQATAYIDDTELDGRGARIQISDPYVKAWLRERIDSEVRVDWDGRTWAITGMAWPFGNVTSVALMPLSAYADLYARVEQIHDAVAEDDQ